MQAIVDASAICHVGFVVEGRPLWSPPSTPALGRWSSSTARRPTGGLDTVPGTRASLSSHHLDGLVLGPVGLPPLHELSLGHVLWHSHLVDDESEKWDALHAITEAVMPGRWEDARQPNPKEMAATLVVAMPIEYAWPRCARVRLGTTRRTTPCRVGRGAALALTPQAPIDNPLLSPGNPGPASSTSEPLLAPTLRVGALCGALRRVAQERGCATPARGTWERVRESTPIHTNLSVLIGERS